MPDRGLLERSSLTPVALGGGHPAPWQIAQARWAQLTFEVTQTAALEALPGDVGRPVPCYARLFVLDAADSPVGPFRLAALMAGGRYRMLPRNVLVQGVVDGTVEAIAGAFGSPFAGGRISLERTGTRAIATIAVDGQLVATLVLPELRAIDAGMLRWDAWLGFAANNGAVELIEYGPRPAPREAFLSKGATLDTPADLGRANPWRRFRNLNTVSSCFVEGGLTLSAPEVQQIIL